MAVSCHVQHEIGHLSVARWGFEAEDRISSLHGYADGDVLAFPSAAELGHGQDGHKPACRGRQRVFHGNLKSRSDGSHAFAQ